jgi:hypothetical protein
MQEVSRYVHITRHPWGKMDRTQMDLRPSWSAIMVLGRLFIQKDPCDGVLNIL